MQDDSPAGSMATERVQQFRTDRIEEAQAWAEQRSGRHHRTVLGQGPLGYELAVLAGSDFEMAICSVGQAQVLRGATNEWLLHVPLSATHHYEFGRHSLAASVGDAILIPSGREFTRKSEPGTLMAIALPESRWVGELRVRGRNLDVAVAARLWKLPASTILSLEMAERWRGARAPNDVLRQWAARCDAQWIAALAQAACSAAGAHASTAATARQVARATAWIDEHVDQPISMDELCAAAGVGERSLQKSFKARFGMSPMRFVVERRLAAAHRLLLSPRAGLSVSQVAADAGFTHLGRFSQLYRHAYGEPPSQTLTRRRARRLPRADSVSG